MFLGVSTFNLSDEIIEVKTTINKAFEPPSDPTTPGDSTCECLSQEELTKLISDLIKTEISNIEIPER